MKSLFLILVILLSASTSFSGNNKPSSLNTPPPTGSLECYYQLDDNWSVSTNNTELAAWEKEKLAVIFEKGLANGILNSPGGGPNGAQWNPETNLFCVAQIPAVKKDEIKTIAVSLNAKQITPAFNKTQSGKDVFVTFWLPKATWQKAARKSGSQEVLLITVTAITNKTLTASGKLRSAYGE